MKLNVILSTPRLLMIDLSPMCIINVFLRTIHGKIGTIMKTLLETNKYIHHAGVTLFAGGKTFLALSASAEDCCM